MNDQGTWYFQKEFVLRGIFSLSTLKNFPAFLQGETAWYLLTNALQSILPLVKTLLSQKSCVVFEERLVSLISKALLWFMLSCGESASKVFGECWWSGSSTVSACCWPSQCVLMLSVAEVVQLLLPWMLSSSSCCCCLTAWKGDRIMGASAAAWEDKEKGLHLKKSRTIFYPCFYRNIEYFG